MTQFIGICATTAVLSATVLMISKGEKELSILVSAAIYVIVMLYAVLYGSAVIEKISESFKGLSNSKYTQILIKAGGISVISSITSSLCENTGQKGIAGAIELLGVIEIIAITIPIVFELILNFMSF